MLAPVLAQLQELHPGDTRLIYRHFPLTSIHDKASLAGEAVEAAGAQGAFWELHDLLYNRTEEWADLSPDQFIEWVVEAASELEVDVEQIEEDLKSGRYAEVLAAARNEALAGGLSSTPTLFFNGSYVRALPDLSYLEALYRLSLLGQRVYRTTPEMTLEPGKEYVATLQLAETEIVIQLFADSAPLAVNSFIFLAQEGWFDGMPIHRVVPESLVETGDPSGTGYGNPGYFFATEIDPALTFDEPGMVAMSSSAPDANGSLFFITLAPFTELDGTRTIFGRVVSGLDFLLALEARDPVEDLLTPPQAIILSVLIEES